MLSNLLSIRLKYSQTQLKMEIKNVTIVIPLKSLSIFFFFWILLKMSFINCKVESKLRLAKHFALVSAGVENADANSNNIIFIIKNTKSCIPVVTIW